MFKHFHTNDTVREWTESIIKKSDLLSYAMSHKNRKSQGNNFVDVLKQLQNDLTLFLPVGEGGVECGFGNHEGQGRRLVLRRPQGSLPVLSSGMVR